MTTIANGCREQMQYNDSSNIKKVIILLNNINSTNDITVLMTYMLKCNFNRLLTVTAKGHIISVPIFRTRKFRTRLQYTMLLLLVLLLLPSSSDEYDNIDTSATWV